MWTLPSLVHQVGAPRLVVIQVLLKLVVDGPGIVLKMNGYKKKKQVWTEFRNCAVRAEQTRHQPEICMNTR